MSDPDTPPTEPRNGSGLRPAQFWFYYQQYPYHLARLALVAVVVLGVLLTLRTVENVLFPLLASMLLAYVFDPVVDWFEGRGYRRVTGIALLLALGGMCLLIFVLFLWPTVAHLIGSLGEQFPKLIDLVRQELIPWVETTFGVEAPGSVETVIRDYGETLKAQLPQLAQSLTAWVGSLWTQTGAVFASLLNVVLIPVLTFYFLRDFDQMKGKAAEFIPVKHRPFLLDRLTKADEVIGAWIRGQIEVAVILAVLYAIGLAIVFGWMGAGVMTGVAVGMMAGLLNFIPYFGFMVGFLLSIAIVLIDWAGWMPLVGVLAVFAVVQGLEGWVITPRIVGEKVGMSAVTVILVLLVGGEVLGLLGVVLAIPVAGAIGVLLPDIIAVYKRSNFYTGAVDEVEPDDPPDPDESADPNEAEAPKSDTSAEEESAAESTEPAAAATAEEPAAGTDAESPAASDESDESDESDDKDAAC